MGRHGPAKHLLYHTRAYFKEHPDRLYELARYSLECGTLITPTFLPVHQESRQRYEDALICWDQLHHILQRNKSISEQDINACLAIHEMLLAVAEEALYPTASYILNMLERSAHDPASWRHIWQQYLLEQMRLGRDITYRECVLLWISLFETDSEQRIIVEAILADYDNRGSPVQECAARFLALLSKAPRDLLCLQHPLYLRDLRELQDSHSVKDLRHLVAEREQRTLRHQSRMRTFQYLRDRPHPDDLLYLRDLLYLQNL